LPKSNLFKQYQPTYASRNLFTSARCSCDAVYSFAQ